MVDRAFSETDLRAMLERAAAYRPDVVPGRFVIETTHDGRPWEAIVEPDVVAELLIVITAYTIAG
jgi:hypothetical protein